MRMRCINHKEGHNFCSELRIIHDCSLKVKHCYKNSAMLFTVQKKTGVLPEYHRERSVTLTQRWVSRVMQKIHCTALIFSGESKGFIQCGNVDHGWGNERPYV